MTSLKSFNRPVRAGLVGASGGLGKAFLKSLAADPNVEEIFAFSRLAPDEKWPKTSWRSLDLEDEGTIQSAAEIIRRKDPSINLMIVATGILHHNETIRPEKTWAALNPKALARIFHINTIGPALVAKHFLPHLEQSSRAIFAVLSARVGSISDNQLGGWHGYRSSKAALNMMMRNFAIEWGRKNENGVCVALHPGTVNTPLSRPFQKGVPEKHLFEPDYAVRQLLAVLDGLKPGDTGGFFAWDGKPVPF